MTAVIIDDNERAALELKRQLEAYPDMQVIGIARNSFDGLAMTTERHPNVLFLDVLMPGVSGIDFLDRVPLVKSGQCRVVMYTAHVEFVLPAIRRRAFDVLLKPIDPKELATIVKRLREEPVKPLEADDNDSSTQKTDMILLYTNSVDFRLVNKTDIGVFQHNGEMRCWEVVLGDQDKPVTMKRSIKAKNIIDIDPNLFMQVNQKYIINMSYLIEVVNGKCRFFPPFDKIDYVTVGHFYRRRLIDRFLSL